MKTLTQLFLLLVVSLFSFQSVAQPFATIGIIGTATPQGWDASTPMDQDPSDAHVWTLNDFVLTDGEAKFRADNDWAVNWGGSDFPSGTGFQDGPNIPITGGTYDITFNDATGAYNFVSDTPSPTFATVGIIGTATPQGWDASTPMDLDVSDPHHRMLTIRLAVGELKFRANDDWAVNWGGSTFPGGTGFQDGPNIVIPTEAYYTIDFNSLSGDYYFTELNPPIYSTVGIIGSATPQGWDASTPMDQDPSDAHVWTLNDFVLTDGEAKFRADNDWAVNWGASDFPSGTGFQDGPNIPIVAGNYDITFNDVTGKYAFAATVPVQDIVTLAPAFPTADEEVLLIYDATQGTSGLVGAEKVYLHSGVVLSGSDGLAWSYVVGNWGQDDGIGLMTKVRGEDNKWQISLSPILREYYGVPAGVPVFRLAMVFRNANGTAEGKSDTNGDIYINIDPGNFVRFTSPPASQVFVESGKSVTITAEASGLAESLEMFIDQGSSFVSVATASNTTQISYPFIPAASGPITVRVEGVVEGEPVEAQSALEIILRESTVVEDLPAGLTNGINYDADPAKVTLVLTAPGKEFVYAVGDFNGWSLSSGFQMKQTSDGEKFWLEIDGLTPGQEYIYQYWVDGVIKIGDPFADKVIDPFNDGTIPEEVYPDLIEDTHPENGIATVLQTNQVPFAWNYPEPVGGRPAREELVIYELLVRDFLESHSYQDLADSLSYLKRLGVNAIELMPVMEFEGNESWGYNPSYLFAPDKYYGTKNDLKMLIDMAHAQGFVVILDMVLNHQFGQSPLVMMYFDEANGRPSEDSPWFNQVATHPFNVGFDFNHESPYTQSYVDAVNKYWVEEYEFDGFRFDLSKGFTQNAGNDPGDVGAWSSYDQSRIDILTRMADKIWETDPNTYIILEHLGANDEETMLSDHGMMLWGNMNYPYSEVVRGVSGTDLNWTLSSVRGWSQKNLVSYMESHDEERLMVRALDEGLSSGSYDIRDLPIALERIKLASAFFYPLPGPKMFWQFGELGYDFSINYNGRIGNKPIPWGDTDGLNYHLDEDRQKLYKATTAIIDLVNDHNEVFEGGDFNWTPTGQLRQINVTHDNMDVTIVGNFGTSNGSMNATFSHTGTWYDFFFASVYEVSSTAQEIELAPGEFHIFTDQPVDFPEPGLVKIFEPIVTVNPGNFQADDRIQIILNAASTDPAGTDGLVGVEKVYLYSGVILDGPEGTTWENIVGSKDQDDGVGEMTPVPGKPDYWMISFRPREYYGLDPNQPVYRLAMYFRSADGQQVGKGTGGEDIFIEVDQTQHIVTIDPADFTADDQIRLVLDATQADPAGTVGLVGAEKVYIHSGVVLTETDAPSGSNWTHVVGNWGQDDGVGQMSPVPGEPDHWEITLTPRDYYEVDPGVPVYFLAMVFRNANGSAEGKGEGGRDIFIRVSQGSPNPPDNLVANVVGVNQVDLFWNDNADNELGYIVERASFPGNDYSTLAFLGKDATAYTDRTVDDCQVYYYRVRATSAFEGDSSYSNTAEASTPLAPPAHLEADPGWLRIDLTWEDNSNHETGYVVERQASIGLLTGHFMTIARLPADATAYTDRPLLPVIKYTYRVKAIAEAKDSQYSNEVTATPDIHRSVHVHLYPNPADNYAILAVEGEDIGRVWVKVHNKYGRVVALYQFDHFEQQQVEINTSEWRSGWYLIEVTTDGFKKTEWLIVHH